MSGKNNGTNSKDAKGAKDFGPPLAAEPTGGDLRSDLDNTPLWLLVVKQLANPRTWIYPIIVLVVAFYFLPRLNKAKPPLHAPQPARTAVGREELDADGNSLGFTWKYTDAKDQDAGEKLEAEIGPLDELNDEVGTGAEFSPEGMSAQEPSAGVDEQLDTGNLE